MKYLVLVALLLLVACTSGPDANQNLLPAPDEPGRITITSDPSGAKLWIDGEPIGNTNITSPPIAPGYHSVRLTHPGYKEANTRAYVYPNNLGEKHIALERE